MKKPLTEAEEDKIREDALAIREMIKTRGWEILRARIDDALATIDARKKHIVTETQAGYEPIEQIGQQYIRLDERARGIKAIPLEVDMILREAEKLDKPATPTNIV